LNGTDTAEIIDLSQPSPTWEYVAPMENRRINACAILLPDGNVIVIGGNSKDLFDNPVYTVQMFNPDSKIWTRLASMHVPRGYHSTALLLPDGRILSSGTTPFGNWELRMEIYSPYYLFRGPRPIITKVVKSVVYGHPFSVSYTSTRYIQSVVLIRPGSVTHAFDMDQRYVELVFTVASTGLLTVEVPRDEHLAPPGYYMLFLLDDAGVPSEAVFVHLPVRH
jgi:Domain of unknown function (DUF1929)/Kelch motif